MRTLTEQYFDAIPGTPWGMRKVTSLDAERLRRLFFLSLIWRAAASNLPEFKEVYLPQAQIERLGNMIVEGVAQPIEFLPISLTQLSTLGLIYSHGIIRQTKLLPGLPGFPARVIPYFRIYVDG